jgi:hypothetical protein
MHLGKMAEELGNFRRERALEPDAQAERVFECRDSLSAGGRASLSLLT